MYPQIPSDIIIIIIMIKLTLTPVLILITIVASDLSSSLLVCSSCPSSSALFVPEPKLLSLFVHLNAMLRSLLCPASSSTSACSFPSSLLDQYSGASTISYPSGIVSNTVTFPSTSPSFVTFMLYLAISSVFFISDVFISNFVNLLSDISTFCPFIVILFNVFCTP